MTTHAVTVTRAELGQATLSLVTSPYSCPRGSFNPGTVSRRRETVIAPYVHGAYEVGSVKDEVEMSMQVFVTGADDDAVQSNVDSLLDAFNQSTYVVRRDLNGTAWAWTCRAADYGINWDFAHEERRLTRVVLSIPRSPIPFLGPL